MDFKMQQLSWSMLGLALPMLALPSPVLATTQANVIADNFSLTQIATQQSSVLGSEAKLVELNNTLVIWTQQALSIYSKKDSEITYLASYSAKELLNDKFAVFSKMHLAADGTALLPVSPGLTPRLFQLLPSGELQPTESSVLLQDLQFSSDGKTIMGKIYADTSYQVYNVSPDLKFNLQNKFSLPYILLSETYDFSSADNLLFLPSVEGDKPTVAVLKATATSTYEELTPVYVKSFDIPLRYESQSKLLFTLGEQLSCYKIPQENDPQSAPQNSFDYCASLAAWPNLRYLDSRNGQLLAKQDNQFLRFDLVNFDAQPEADAEYVDGTEAILAEAGVFRLSEAALNFDHFSDSGLDLELKHNTQGISWNGEQNWSFTALTDNLALNSDGKNFYLYKIAEDKIVPQGVWHTGDFFSAAEFDEQYNLQIRKTQQGQFVVWRQNALTLANVQTDILKPESKFLLRLDDAEWLGADFNPDAQLQFFGSYILVPGKTKLHLLKIEQDKIVTVAQRTIEQELDSDWANPDFNTEVDGQLFHYSSAENILVKYSVTGATLNKSAVPSDINSEKTVRLHGNEKLLFVQQDSKLVSYKVQTPALALQAQHDLIAPHFKVLSKQLAAEYGPSNGLRLYQIDNQSGTLTLLHETTDNTDVAVVHRVFNKLIEVSKQQAANLTLFNYNLPPYLTENQAELKLNQGQVASIPLAGYLQDDEQYQALEFKLANIKQGFIIEGGSLSYDGKALDQSELLIVATDEMGASTELKLNYSYNSAPQPKQPLDSIKVNEAQSLKLSIAPLFVDPEGQAFTFSPTSSDGISLSEQGELTGKLTQSLTLTTKLMDEAGATADYQLQLIVNKAPVVRDATAVIKAEAGKAISQSLNSLIQDPEGASLRYTAVTLPDGMKLSGTNNELLTGSFAAAGNYNLIVTATDPDGASAELRLNIQVSAATENAEQPSNGSGGVAGWNWFSLLFLSWYGRRKALFRAKSGPTK